MLTDLVVSQKVVKVNEFTVVGVPIRTDEPVEETGTGLIPEHWQTFYKQQLANKIANKVNGNTFIQNLNMIKKWILHLLSDMKFYPAAN
jgi:predicted transcriptional regulator YdeE